jgi:hypothetical protein
MTEAENIVLEHLRAIRADVADIKAAMLEVKERLGIIEQQYASLSVRLDRTGADIERVKRRLDLTEA